MGMYDSIIITRLTCPYCKKKLKNIDFQTKDGSNSMASFYMGDIFPLYRHFNLSPKSKITWISALASCPKCHIFNRKTMKSTYTWLEASFAIENKTRRIIQFELWRFMRDLPETQKQQKYFRPRKKPRIFNPSRRKLRG
jgi:hypothetical protein